MPLEDASLMPYGKYKDQKMIDVPASYLLWMHEQIRKMAPNKRSLQQKLVFDYVKTNYQALEKEENNERNGI
jgi:phage I-like protein